MKATRIGCFMCGWRGRRVPGECACYDEWGMYCRCRWGSCPKCKGRISTMESIKEWKQQAKEARAHEHRG